MALVAAVFLMAAFAQATPLSAGMSKSGFEKVSTGDAEAVALASPNFSEVPGFADHNSIVGLRLSDHEGWQRLAAQREPTPVPEPTSLLLVGVGLLLIASLVRRRAGANARALSRSEPDAKY
jgi:hypothetical protein